jgi:hypothetical protein
MGNESTIVGRRPGVMGGRLSRHADAVRADDSGPRGGGLKCQLRQRPTACSVC